MREYLTAFPSLVILVGIALAAAYVLFSIEVMGFAAMALVIAILYRIMVLLDAIVNRAA